MQLHLVLTGQCNLACGYCYQSTPRSGTRMGEGTARDAVRNTLAAGDPPHRVVISGGEPFLAPELIRSVIRYARDHEALTGRVECAVLTNGTLVTDEDLDFLAAHDVELQLSFDGVESAQAHRAPGTFARLDGLIARARKRQRNWASHRLSVAMMLQGSTVSTLAESIRYLLGVGVSEIGVEPLATHDPGWTPLSGGRLATQVDAVVRDSLDHWERTGEIPVTFLRLSARRRETAGPRAFVCAAPSGRNVAVDPSGRAWGCPSFVPGLQRLPPLGEEAAAGLHLGDVRHPDFRQRLAELPRRAGTVPLLLARAKGRSVSGRCGDCPHAEQCLVCPAATCFIPGNRDPHRIPDNQCDFQRLTLEARQRFHRRAAGPSLLRETRCWMGPREKGPRAAGEGSHPEDPLS
jgi:sulfatase maturation enzyme AslB (radical SAM superfamily)